MRYAVVGLGIALAFTSSSAFCAEEYPFPQLQTEAFCKISVSKMLNHDEQAAELTKCLFSERFLKERLEPWWPFLSQNTRREIVKKRFKYTKHHTYTTVLGLASFDVGYACITGRIECENPERR